MHCPISCRLFLLLATAFLSLNIAAQLQDTIIVHFDYNQSAITKMAGIVIDNYFTSLKNRFTVQSVELYGHCDSIGGNRYNDSLSARRVKSVKEYIDDNWLKGSVYCTGNGYGKNFPLNNNKTSIYREQNRRAEIVISKVPIEKPTPKRDTIFAAPKKISLYEKIMDTATVAGNNIVLEQIVFYGGRHFPMPQSYTAIKDLLNAMQMNVNLKIEINGYVCCEPDDRDGDDTDTHKPDLSVQRAKFIYNYLVEHGIEKNRMHYKGFGGSNKLYPEERNATEQTLNRRVEIKIISK